MGGMGGSGGGSGMGGMGSGMGMGGMGLFSMWNIMINLSCTTVNKYNIHCPAYRFFEAYTFCSKT